jgi:hypothetical protein
MASYQRQNIPPKSTGSWATVSSKHGGVTMAPVVQSASKYNMQKEMEFIGLEPLSAESGGPIDYEQTLYQALVNEGKHVRVCTENIIYDIHIYIYIYVTCFYMPIILKVLNAKRPNFSYNGINKFFFFFFDSAYSN